MLKALGQTLAGVAIDKRVRAVVIAANGPVVFARATIFKEITARRRDGRRRPSLT